MGNILRKCDQKVNSSRGIKAYSNLVSEIESEGYQSSEKAFSLAMWIREQLAKLATENNGYDLRVDILKIPQGISKIIKDRCKDFSNYEIKKGISVSLDDLFPDPKVRSYALERVQLLHKGNLFSYLNSLVKRERDSLIGESASIMDLIHICQEKLKRRNFKVVSNFNANEVDLWVPEVRLGIEIRDALSGSDSDELITILKNTNSSKNTRFLVLICPDDLSDLIFHNWREIERSGVLENLSVIRVGDFGSYLDKIADTTQSRNQ